MYDHSESFSCLSDQSKSSAVCLTNQKVQPVCLTNQKALPVCLTNQKTPAVCLTNQQAPQIFLTNQETSPVRLTNHCNQQAPPVCQTNQQALHVCLTQQQAPLIILTNQKASPLYLANQSAEPISSCTSHLAVFLLVSAQFLFGPIIRLPPTLPTLFLNQSGSCRVCLSVRPIRKLSINAKRWEEDELCACVRAAKKWIQFYMLLTTHPPHLT